MSAKIPICAHIVLKSNLILAHPDAEWVFFEGNAMNEYDIYNDMYEKIDNGKCVGLVAAVEDVLGDRKIMEPMCDRNLMYTSSIVLEMPVSLPACKEIVAGISYWMHEAKKKGILFETYQEKTFATPVCTLSLRQNQIDGGDENSLHRLTLANFALPLLMLAFCCVISAVLQFRHQARGRRRRRTMLRSRDSNKNDSYDDDDDDDYDYEKKKEEEKEEKDDDSDHQQQQYQHQNLSQQPIMLPPIEDLKPKDMLRTLQIYQSNLIELMIKEQRKKEHEE